MRWLFIAIVTVACGRLPGSATPSSPTPSRSSTVAAATTAAREAPSAAGPPTTVANPGSPTTAPNKECPGAAVRFEAGRATEILCPDDAAALGLTIVDLHDLWAPRLFAASPDGREPTFRARYLALAAGRDSDGNELDDVDQFSELFGVLPSLAIVRDRLADDARHDCNARVDSAPIALIDQPYAQEYEEAVERADQTRTAIAIELERERAGRQLADFAALAAVPELAPRYARWKRLDDVHRGIVAVQRHLVCERFLSEGHADGSMTSRTANAVQLFQRRNFLMPNQHLDPETREAFARDSRELDFRLALRILRERVADVSGLIEDGTAGAGPQPILGRMLDPAAMRAARGGDEPLPDGAEDLISPATEAAARQLGWTSPAELRRFLERYPRGLLVALEQPEPPAYHSEHMDLTAELDRGDVWYDETPIRRRSERRPTLILYVNDRGTKRPLIRWPTTIGGWSDIQVSSGGVVQRWKESEVGPRVWRELYAAPTWLPPRTTPDRELVRNTGDGSWELKAEILGPGPRGAFGMMLLVHDLVTRRRDGSERFDDHGIGTHGSASVVSIVDGTSHGCHRLYNQLAVRLADFLLHHRNHIVKGDQPLRYRRVVKHKGRHVARADTRGFLYELSPPVPINVLPGTILSSRKVPPRASAPARPD